MMKKICAKCKKNKALEDYYKDATKKEGKRTECKNCKIIEQKKYYIKNKQKIQKYNKEYHKIYYINNKQKIQEYHKNHHAKNKQKINERQKKYYANNKEKISGRQKVYYANNKEKISENRQKHLTKNKQEIKEYHKNYHTVNRDKILEYKKVYFKTDKGKITAAKSRHNRRSRESKTLNTLTAQQVNIILFLQNYKCIYPDCNEYFDIVKPTIDHIVPVSKGGSLIKENIQYLCQKHNSEKYNKIIDCRSSIHKEIISKNDS